MKIEIEALSKTIKGVDILKEINMTLVPGKVYGLRGKNGSGKTMLMRAILGLILPTRGTVKIDSQIVGKDISFPLNAGALIENPAFLDNYTGIENLRLIAAIRGDASMEQLEEALSTIGLDPKDKRKYRKYSLGMKQRLGIACAIMENPSLLILDEPTNALDDSGVTIVHTIIENFKRRGALIIVSCHDKEELEVMADIIYTISDGKLVLEGDDDEKHTHKQKSQEGI